MSYYPKSQITTGLYTNGGEFVYINTLDVYVGNYWKTSNGKYFTGKTPQDLPSREISVYKDPINETFNTEDNPSPVFKSEYQTTYDILKNIDSFQVTYAPTYSPTIPIQQDYQIGEYRRYFCKKTNEIIYLEINKDTYDKLVNKDSKILYQLYQPFNLPWKLTGDKSQVFIINKNITELTSKQQNLPMLSEYLRNDFTKYYK
jgi:hypothetical protein